MIRHGLVGLDLNSLPNIKGYMKRNRKEYFKVYYQRPEIKKKEKARQKKRIQCGYFRQYWQRDYVKDRNRNRQRDVHLEKIKSLGFENKCSMCGWSESVCDIHHITPLQVTVLCPNCHRKIHRGLL